MRLYSASGVEFPRGSLRAALSPPMGRGTLLSGVCFPSERGGVLDGMGDPMLLGRIGVVGADSVDTMQATDVQSHN
jgi:hypothetical protein